MHTGNCLRIHFSYFELAVVGFQDLPAGLAFELIIDYFASPRITPHPQYYNSERTPRRAVLVGILLWILGYCSVTAGVVSE